MNKMIEIKTPFVVDARCMNLFELEDAVLDTFVHRIVTLHHDITEENNKLELDRLYTLGFYKTFTDTRTKNVPLCQRIYISENNIIFEKMIYPKELLKKKIEEHKDGLKVDELYKISSIQDWYSLFGQGEFPFIIIRAFKLGGVEYYTYSITR